MKYPMTTATAATSRNLPNMAPPEPLLMKNGKADRPRKRTNQVISLVFESFFSLKVRAHAITAANAIK